MDPAKSNATPILRTTVSLPNAISTLGKLYSNRLTRVPQREATPLRLRGQHEERLVYSNIRM